MTTVVPPTSALTANNLWGDDEEATQLEQQISGYDTTQLQTRVRMLENNIRVMKSETNRLTVSKWMK
jgi:hypothetical protein